MLILQMQSKYIFPDYLTVFFSSASKSTLPLALRSLLNAVIKFRKKALDLYLLKLKTFWCVHFGLCLLLGGEVSSEVSFVPKMRGFTFGRDLALKKFRSVPEFCMVDFLNITI